MSVWETQTAVKGALAIVSYDKPQCSILKIAEVRIRPLQSLFKRLADLGLVKTA